MSNERFYILVGLGLFVLVYLVGIGKMLTHIDNRLDHLEQILSWVWHRVGGMGDKIYEAVDDLEEKMYEAAGKTSPRKLASMERRKRRTEADDTPKT